MIAAVLLASALTAAPSVAPSVAERAVPEVTRRATLYAFFATWCVPCRVELPHIERLHRAYAPRGLRVLLVSEDAPSTAADIPAFLSRFGVTAPWHLDDESTLLARYHPPGSLPFVVLLDDAGHVLYAHAGYEPGDEHLLERAVATALEGPETPAEAGASMSVSSAIQTFGALRSTRFAPAPEADGRLQAGAARVEIAAALGDRGDDARCRDGPCLEASVRADAAMVSDRALRDVKRDVRVERASLGIAVGPVRAVAGDGHVAFGKGLALSLRRVDTLGQDLALRGGRFDLELGRLILTALGGVTNRQNLDPVLFRVVDDVSDPIAGASLTYRPDERRRIGPYVVVARADAAAPDGSDVDWATVGAVADWSFGDLRLAADVSGGRREGLSIDGAETVLAAYAAAAVDLGDTTTLVEAKHYRRWEMGRPDRALLYHEPPTLERTGQEVPSNRDASGARVRTEWRITPRATAYGNLLGYFYSKDGSAPIGEDLALHGYAGVDLRSANDLSLALVGGARRETAEDGREVLSLWHADADVSVALSSRLALTAKIEHTSETRSLIRPKSFVRGLAVIGGAISGWGAMSLLYGYSTEQDSRPTHYPAAELKLTLPAGGEWRLFVGRLAGGVVCVSGSCRDLPPFEGARMDFVIRLGS